MDVQLLIGAGLLLLSIIFSKISGKFGVPALIVFLAVGILAGPEGLGRITFDQPYLTKLLGVVALINILFSGGLETSWPDLKPVLGRGLLLATVGLCINAVLVAFVMRLLFPVSWLEGLLYGSIIGCTDAAAVFSVLRSRNLSLKGGLGPMTELESASNDPMAVFLSLALIQLIQTPGSSIANLIPSFFLQMGMGAACGFVMGRVIPWAINTLNLEQEGLYPPLSVALAVLTYAIAAALGGSGFLAVYVAGIVMNTQRFYHKRSLVRFHAGFSWLMQIMMFVTLGLLLRPSELSGLIGNGVVLSAFLIFVARPISVFLTLLFAKLSMREKLMASWLGLRGAVPIILGTFTLYSGVAAAHLIFNLVFFVVLLSVLIQGTTLTRVAEWLKVTLPLSPKHLYKIQSGAMLTDSSELTEIVVPDGSPLVGRTIMSLGLGSDSIVMLIHRDGATIVPAGRTTIQPGDVLVLLADVPNLEQVRGLMSGHG
jgi:cell volume regulation protein A